MSGAIETKHSSYRWKMVVAAIAAFCVYTCMYAYRKPFTAAGFDNLHFLGVDYKIWLVVTQTIGYTLSKFYGIRFVAELNNAKRFRNILLFIGIAWLALLCFAIVPAPYNILFLLINGFPLGIIYGLVFSYLEGRRSTEFLGAVLASSFIFASGFTQSAGKFVMLQWNVSVWWMPFVTGLIFFPPLVFFSWLLNKTPEPDAEDKAERTERKTMNRSERKNFIREFFTGLTLLIIVYVMLTIIRDYRSNFASDIWKELGWGGDVSVFTQSELLPSVVVLLIMSLLVMVHNNIRALLINHTLIIIGLFLSAASTVMFSLHWSNGFWWMTLTGTGLYMGYVPFNCMLFERIIASFKHVSTAGFIIYVADSFGYLGSDAVLLVKNFSNISITWTDFFVNMIMIVSVVGVVLTFFSVIYFKRKYHRHLTHQVNIEYA